jgi:negative regulator of sigma-B (phosphoserine phosphatase)
VIERAGDASESVECAVAWANMPGEDVCGDRHLANLGPATALVGVIDGLGHGPEAARAAEAAIEVIGDVVDVPIPELIERCHAALRPTRGAAMTLVHIDARRALMTWAGVGNVEARLVPQGTPGRDRSVREAAIMLRGGVVGYQLPTVTTRSIPLEPGDSIVLASDGLTADYVDDVKANRTPAALAEDVLSSHRKGTDDALVLVARYLGAPG